MKYLLTSRKFWAALIGLVVVIVGAFSPSFELDIDGAASLAVIVVSYIIGVAVDPGPGGWRGVLQSRKFWAALVGLAVIILTGFGIQLPFGITQEIVINIAVVIGAYISGTKLFSTTLPNILPKPSGKLNFETNYWIE